MSICRCSALLVPTRSTEIYILLSCLPLYHLLTPSGTFYLHTFTPTEHRFVPVEVQYPYSYIDEHHAVWSGCRASRAHSWRSSWPPRTPRRRNSWRFHRRWATTLQGTAVVYYFSGRLHTAVRRRFSGNRIRRVYFTSLMIKYSKLQQYPQAAHSKSCSILCILKWAPSRCMIQHRSNVITHNYWYVMFEISKRALMCS